MSVSRSCHKSSKVILHTVIGQTILHGNLQGVSPVRSDHWHWKLTIDSEDLPRCTVRSHGRVGDFETVRNDLAGGGPTFVKISSDAVSIAPTLSGQRSIGTSLVLTLDQVFVNGNKLCSRKCSSQ